MHIILVNEILQSQKSIRKSKSEDNTLLIIQLIVITLSNILCWFPVNAVYVSAMFLPTYPTYPVDLVIWSTVLGLPINSLINPIVFIIISVRKYRTSTEPKNFK